MANLISANNHYTFDVKGKRVMLEKSGLKRNTTSERLTKFDISYWAGIMFPTSTISISPEYFTYEEMKEKFTSMLEKKNYENVKLIK